MSRPPVLYVSDTLNNRVLAWEKTPADFRASGAKADFVIGQKDFYSTQPLGPGTPGQRRPEPRPNGLAVDRSGKPVRRGMRGTTGSYGIRGPYTQPFEQLPDRVIGQANFNSSGSPNTGGVRRENRWPSRYSASFTTAGLAF